MNVYEILIFSQNILKIIASDLHFLFLTLDV